MEMKHRSRCSAWFIYHLIASKDEDINNILEKMIIIIDPIMNPDGRARFTKSLEQYRGTSPNYDDQFYYILAIGHTEEQTIIILI